MQPARVRRMPVIQAGLILHLDSGNLNSYPGSGTTWKDLSGGGNHGILQGDPPVYTAESGGILSFNGNNQRVLLDNPLVTNGITVSVWVQMDGSNVTLAGSSVIENGDATSAQFRLIYFPGGAFQWVLQTTNNGWYTPGTHLFVVGDYEKKWCNILGTYSPGSLKLYANGTLMDSSGNLSGNLFNVGANLNRIAYSPANNINYGRGKYAGFLIYNRALTAAEVAYNFRCQGSRFGLSSGLAEIGRKFHPS